MTSPGRTNVRRVEVTPMGGKQITARPRAKPHGDSRPGDDPEVEIFRADPEWFAV